jgi:hypothetical protein
VEQQGRCSQLAPLKHAVPALVPSWFLLPLALILRLKAPAVCWLLQKAPGDSDHGLALVKLKPASFAGDKWYGLPAPKVTDEVKQELRLLRLRGAYDPKRFYRSFDRSKFPKYFQVRSGGVSFQPARRARRTPAHGSWGSLLGRRRAALTRHPAGRCTDQAPGWQVY